MPSSPPIIAQRPLTGIKNNSLIDTCGGRIPCLYEIACWHGGSFSNDESAFPFECTASRAITKTAERGVPPLML